LIWRNGPCGKNHPVHACQWPAAAPTRPDYAGAANRLPLSAPALAQLRQRVGLCSKTRAPARGHSVAKTLLRLVQPGHGRQRNSLGGVSSAIVHFDFSKRWWDRPVARAQPGRGKKQTLAGRTSMMLGNLRFCSMNHRLPQPRAIAAKAIASAPTHHAAGNSRSWVASHDLDFLDGWAVNGCFVRIAANRCWRAPRPRLFAMTNHSKR